MSEQEAALFELPESKAPSAYRVLARKYRPSGFAELVGQEAMVRTLSNAFETGRIAHAYLLTGVRGVGKTTTARIIAKALNCIGPDGNGGPTISPCGVCDPCKSIAASRHIDVLEMDAASRTGINDIRELIDGVNYLPASARYKVYIIDEVHMLSTAAFNGLLKTLEEPPPHVKFIFATTELRKIPITVISRCQRFDLRRLDQMGMSAHLGRIAGLEGIAIEDGALALLARASEGSVRDGLSLLDQAIAHGSSGPSGTGGGNTISADQLREMLGLSDRTRLFGLFGHVMAGRIAEALAELRSQYDAGADPQTVLRDLLDLVHLLTRAKLVPEAAEDPSLSETERDFVRDTGARLAMPVLARCWQMLLKGFSEVRDAPAPIQAAEMLIIRLAYAAELPNPADLVRQLKDGASGPGETTHSSAPSGGGPRMAATSGATMRAMAQPAPRPSSPQPTSFAELAEFAGQNREVKLKYQIETHLHPVRFERGRIEFRPTQLAAPSLAAEIADALNRWTGQRWVVSISNETGEPTLAERKKSDAAALKVEITAHPLVQAALTAFPNAQVVEIRDIRPQAEPEAIHEDWTDDQMGADAPWGPIDPYEDAEEPA